MYLSIRLNTNALTTEELEKALKAAQQVAPLIDIDQFAKREHVVILRDEQGRKIGEMGVMG